MEEFWEAVTIEVAAALIVTLILALVFWGRVKIATAWATREIKKGIKYFTVGKSRIGNGSVVKGKDPLTQTSTRRTKMTFDMLFTAQATDRPPSDNHDDQRSTTLTLPLDMIANEGACITFESLLKKALGAYSAHLGRYGEGVVWLELTLTIKGKGEYSHLAQGYGNVIVAARRKVLASLNLEHVFAKILETAKEGTLNTLRRARGEVRS